MFYLKHVLFTQPRRPSVTIHPIAFSALLFLCHSTTALVRTYVLLSLDLDIWASSSQLFVH